MHTSIPSHPSNMITWPLIGRGGDSLQRACTRLNWVLKTTSGAESIEKAPYELHTMLELLCQMNERYAGMQ